jgi:hypothetical protein
MKRNVYFMTVLIILFGLISSCQKTSVVNAITPPALTIADSIKNKNWWGTFSYTGARHEYYSVEFNADGSLLWEQYSGDTKGHWTLTDKKISISFEGNDEVITADISGNYLINFSDNTDKSEILTGNKLNNPHISVAGSIWTTPYNTILDFSIIFLSEDSASVRFFVTSYDPHQYQRYPNSGVFRIQYGAFPVIFGIAISDQEIVGSFNNYPFRLPKQ